jgi:hypothetical protein
MRTIERRLWTSSWLANRSSHMLRHRDALNRPNGITHVSGSWAELSGGHGHTMSL